MEKEKVVELLESLQEDVDAWDRDDIEISKLADETIVALKYAIQIIESSNVVGSLNIGQETYLVTK